MIAAPSEVHHSVQYAIQYENLCYRVFQVIMFLVQCHGARLDVHCSQILDALVWRCVR
jgi:hypothetical protein